MRLVDKAFRKLTRNLDLSLGVQQPAGSEEDLLELEVSAMVPYDYHYDDQTVMTKESALVQVIKIDGLLFDSLTEEQVKQFEVRRNTLLRTVASSNLGLYVHTIRRKVFDFPEGEGGTWFSKQLNAAWRGRYQHKGFYVNEIYISLVRNRFRSGVPGLMDRGIALITGTSPTKQDAESYDDMADDLYKAANLLLGGLSEYGATRLKVQRHPKTDSKMIDRDRAYDAVRRFRWSWADFKEHNGDLLPLTEN